ncbi:MAG TPA: heme-binding domain-containing protein [Leptospiraceae bacterium]|nr:heme-binding domain-containing protein [Leptospiraceae bacterium]HNO23337.1 heme-binding domain-containing protein [Leptospiraceae bacterium]
MILKLFLSLSIIFSLSIGIGVFQSRPEPQETVLSAERNVTEILRRSCFDCHSSEVRWPWYSYIFPLSSLIAHHIKEGREELDFSVWDSLSVKKRNSLADKIIEEIDKNEMPLKSYTFMHREAVLSSEDREILKNWAKGFMDE